MRDDARGTQDAHGSLPGRGLVLVADEEPVFQLGAMTILGGVGMATVAVPGDRLVEAVLSHQRDATLTRAALTRAAPTRAPLTAAGPTRAASSDEGAQPLGLLLDATLGSGPYAVDTVAALTSAVPGLGVVVVIGRMGNPGLVEVLEAGARALVHRQCSPEELVAAVRSALDGTNWVSAPLAGPVRAELLSESSGDRSHALTPRELEVLRGLALGRTNVAIGSSLGISEHTVRNHVHSVLRKLGVANRTDAVATALRRGLVDLAD